MLTLYRILIWASLPFALLFLALRQRGALHLGERLGALPRRDDSPIWIQASSAGEVRLAQRLCVELESMGIPTALTSTTSAGLALALSESGGGRPAAACPLDWGPAVARAFDRLQPRALVLIETELWPGMLAEARRRKVPAAVLNARLSGRSLRHFHLLKSILGALLPNVAIGAQDEENARRFLALGASPALVAVTGNMKYDMAIPPTFHSALRDLYAFLPKGGAPLWVAGSVREGEEPAVLKAHCALRRRIPEVRLLLAPRHLGRVPEFRESARKLGLRCVSRSASPSKEWDVLLLDTLGELLPAYALGEVAFVGGSLVPLGGQNLIEPAFLGKPVLFGPSTANFRLEAERIEAAGGGMRVSGPEALADEVYRLLSQEKLREETGRRARTVLDAHKGATRRCAELAASLIPA